MRAPNAIELDGLRRLAEGMGVRDLMWQVNNPKTTGVSHPVALAVFRDELKKRGPQNMTTDATLVELNHFRKVLKMKPVAKRRGSDDALQAALKALAQKVIKIDPKNKRAMARLITFVPAAVAEGAYASKEEAVAKTGHTTNGKTKQQQKHEDRMAQLAAKNLKKREAETTGKKVVTGKDVGAKDKPQRGGARVRTLEDGEIHLKDIAAHIKMEPKRARVMARKHAGAIAKLEVKGKKYVFPKTSRDKIAAILKG